VIGRIARPSAFARVRARVSGAHVSPRHSLRARRECAWRRSELFVVAGQMATQGLGGLGYSPAHSERPGDQYYAFV